MQFIILMSEDPSWDALSTAEQSRIITAHEQFEADLQAQGSYVSSARFGPDAGMAVVRSANGNTSTAAGPESGHGAIGGYYLIDVADITAALDWAERCRFITGTNWVYPIWQD